MNLRQKVLFTLSVAFIVIIFVLFAISSTYLISSYENLESTYVSHEVSLVRSHLDSRIMDTYVLAGDWGVWEDNYQYVTGKNPGFAEEMIHPGVLSNIHINLLIITDSRGDVVYGTGFDTRNGRMVPVPPEILRELSDPATPLRRMSLEHEVKGIVSLPEGAMILGAHPILHADLSGPPAGMVIMGRYVDDTMIAGIGTTALNTITLSPVTPGSLNEMQQTSAGQTPAGVTVPASIPGTSPDARTMTVTVRPLNDELVEGSTGLEDIRGNDALELSVRMPRDIYQQGKNTIFSFLLILANVALIIGIIVILLIDKFVLSRLSALHKDVDLLGKRGDLSSRLTLKGDDEISFLATAMNKTLDKLEAAQKNLQKSETSFRTLIETTPTSIAQTDLTGTIIYCNRQMANSHGYNNVEEIQGKFLFDFIAREDRSRAMIDLTRALKEGQIRNIEYHAVKKDGTLFWIEMSVSALISPQGTPESFIVVGRDISRRKTWESRLRASEERYRAVFENTGTATVIIDENTTITLANTEFTRLSGFSREEIEGKLRWTEFVVKEDLDQMLAKHRQRRIDSATAIKKYEFRFVTKTGLIREIFLSIDMIPATNLSIASLIDITERKRAEEAIIQSENKLNTIIDSSPIPQFVIDKNHQVIHWNKALENLTGVLSETVMGTDRHWTAFYASRRPCIADLVVDNLIENVPEYYTGKFRKSTLLSGQYEVTDFFPYMGCSGKWLYFTSTSLSDPSGNVTGAIETLVDITDRKKSEEEISRTNEQMTSAMQELQATQEVMQETIAELEDAKKQLQKSEAKYRDIATNIPGIVFQFVVRGANDYSIPFISDRIISMFTLGPDEIYSNPNALFNLIHVDDVDFVRASLMESARTLVPWNIEFRMKAKGDEVPRWFNGRGIPHKMDTDNTLWDGVLIDITDRKHLEEKIGSALKEKELLLKEIHHRVKNNIQVIASLLNMQSRTVNDPVTREVLREAQNRVKSIALVHEKLYQSKSLDRIDYHDYLQKISRHLYDSYGVSPRNVVMNIHAENISLHIDKAVPCSLIINELLSNAFKHAFPDGKKGDVWIDIHRRGESLVLTYRDNGVGLPEGISIEQSDSLGMRLLVGLTRQLHGTIDIQRIDGTRITITFPYENGISGA